MKYQKIEEGLVSKGGVGKPPKTPPPSGQNINREIEMTIEQAVEIIGNEPNPSLKDFAKAMDVLYEFCKKYLKDIDCEPQLGCATTEELLDEIKARIELNGDLKYRTIHKARSKKIL